MAYIGNSLSTDVGVNQYEYTATSGQTDFACVYDTTVDVYLNGLRLAETDYSKPDGLKVVLAVGATAGDIVAINAFENVATISSANSDFTVIGDLDVGGTLTVGNIDALNIDADTVDGLHASNLLRSDASDTYSGGLLKVNNTAGEDIITATGAIDGLQVFQPTAGADALMTFHIGSDYACHFGLDGGINDLVVGGWSFGGNSYKIWHQGNDGAGSGLDADTVDGVHASSFALKSGPELEKYITFNDYDDGSAANTGLRTYVRDGTWYVNNDVSASNTINISLGGHTVWHAGNDGSGSGLDADTLDNLNSTAFGRLATASNWSRTQSYNRTTLTDAATINWDMSLSPSASVSLSANRTMGNPTNIKAGNWYTLKVYHSGAPRTLAWSSYWKFGGNGAPALSTVAGRHDVLTFYAHSTTALTFVGITLHTAGA
jgi:hypothetical protein